MIAAALAAVYAARAAGAARRTVEAFTEVEQATLYVELSNFRFTNVTIDFDIVANNLGRSAALVLFAGYSWMNSNKIKDFKGGMNNIGSQIVPAAGKVNLKTVKTTPEALNTKPFLWLLMSTRAPLQGEIVHRMCFRPAAGPNTLLGLRYTGEYSDEIKKDTSRDARVARWWTDIRGRLSQRTGLFRNRFGTEA